jgi:hypothetical protein
MEETLFPVSEARDVATARGVLHKHDVTRPEPANLAIAGLVFNGAIQRNGKLPFRGGVEVEYAQFRRHNEQLDAVRCTEPGELKWRELWEQRCARQWYFGAGEVRLAVLVGKDPGDLHRLQTPSNSSSVIGQVGESGCGGWSSIRAGSAFNASV